MKPYNEDLKAKQLIELLKKSSQAIPEYSDQNTVDQLWDRLERLLTYVPADTSAQASVNQMKRSKTFTPDTEAYVDRQFMMGADYVAKTYGLI